MELPQYITPRFTAAEVEKYAAPLKARIAELEAQLAARATAQCLRIRIRKGGKSETQCVVSQIDLMLCDEKQLLGPWYTQKHK